MLPVKYRDMEGIMSISKVSAARQTVKMIGREADWQQLKDALEPGGAFRVVLVRGRGGIGKTRLLEELQRELGLEVDDDNDPELSEPALPAKTGDIAVSNIIDVIDARLHDRYRFLTALRKGLLRYRSNVNFGRFDAQRGEVENLLASGALLGTLSKAQDELAQAFVDDLAVITQERRVVFLVDTVERLSYPGFDWLLDENLLLTTDLEIRTHQWLQSFIKSGLQNVTLVLAGRDRVYDEPEGERFFGRIKQAIEKAVSTGTPVELIDIDLKPLSDDETRQYLVQLANEWGRLGPQYRTRAESFEQAAAPNHNRFKTLNLLTGGIPVRLALYAQVIAEGREIPEPLKLSYDQVCRRAEITPEDRVTDFDALVATKPTLQRLQWDVEEEFIYLLFSDPDDLRQKLLRALVRAPRGLTAEQLHFALYTSGDDEAEWKRYFATPANEREASYREMLALLRGITRDDYLGRGRPRLDEIVLYVENPITGAATNRYGLQDEIYRIYAEHIGLFAEPLGPTTKSIRESLQDQDGRYQESWKREKEARGLLFKKLAYFAACEFERLLAIKRAHLLNDEVQFEEHFALDSPDTYNFPQLHLAQRNERLALHTHMTIIEIERMIYDFLCNPEYKLNSIYHSLEFDNDQAARQETDYWAQAEIWRVVNEPSTMKFLQLHPRELAKARGETSFDVLRRVVDQENVSRWIKRFVLRGQAERAVLFGEGVQNTIIGWPKGNGSADATDEERAQHSKWRSWNHTLVHEEREIWIQVGHIRQGTNNQEATRNIMESIQKLERLYWTTVEDKAFEDGERVEYGFAPSKKLPAHPAYIRVRRLLSHAYNHLGYGRRTLGHMYEATDYYTTSLEYVREDRDQMIAHRAKVLNNLSRALSELGWSSIGVCLDGRDLRMEMAEEVPLASSYNTLALIYDDMGRYEDAPLLAAKAIAYCRRAQEKRQLGMALRQMAESLRHVAERLQTGQRVAGSPDSLFNAAETLLNEARTIFVALGEAERLVEVDLEFGSLFRDRVHTGRNSTHGNVDIRTRRMYYREALNLLDLARRRAIEHKMPQHSLDALVNQARIHYYAGDLEASEEVLGWIFSDDTYDKHLIRPESESLPPSGDVDLRDRNWVFRHFSTAQRTRASMAADRFQQRVESRKVDSPDESYEDRAEWVSRDAEAQNALRTMMEAYALALAYAELFSPRSRSIGALHNDLYRRIKKFNRSEFEALKHHIDDIGRKPSPNEEEQDDRIHYPVLRAHSLATLHHLLDEFFGARLRMTAEQEGQTHER